jgi:hypothetical protein
LLWAALVIVACTGKSGSDASDRRAPERTGPGSVTREKADSSSSLKAELPGGMRKKAMAAPAEAKTALTESELERDAGAMEKHLRKAKFRRIKPMSSRSRSVRLYLVGGGSALFKPMLVGDSSARLEVAFYRLATLLRVRTIPVSVMRPIYPDRFETALLQNGEDEARAFMDALERDDRGRVWGAMIEWLDGLTLLGTEDDKGRLDVRRLFEDEGYRNLWASLSDIVLLDYLLGNWDRFSGGNLFRMKDGHSLALIDHNEAFYKLNGRQKEKLTESLGAVRCFSPELVSRLRDLTREEINSALKTTDWRGDLLRKVEIGNILMRKDTLLKFIDSRIAAVGGAEEWKCN